MNCLKVTKLISDSYERKLFLPEKIGVRVHSIICPHCRKFKQHCDQMSKLMKDFINK